MRLLIKLLIAGGAISAPAFTVTMTALSNASGSVTTQAFITGSGGSEFITLPTAASVASRLTGVAPLSVFFDTVGTTSVGTSKVFHDIEYRWNFGDSGAGNWAIGARVGQSKNTHRGPVACRVFEAPGTYTVNLDATDGVHTSSRTITITVTDPDTVFASNTVCFSTSGDFTGAPAGATLVTTSDHAAAIATYKSTKKRMLFRAGETFTSASSPVIDVQGPGLIGSFGSGAKPIWRRSGTGYVNLSMGTGSGGAIIEDWRVVDIDIDGQLSTDTYNVGMRSTQTLKKILFLRTVMRRQYRGIDCDLGANTGTVKQYCDEITAQDCTFDAIPGALGTYGTDWRIWGGFNRLAVQGCSLDNQDDGGSHVIRLELAQNSLIANNYVARSGSSQHIIKLHAPQWDGSSYSWLSGVYSERVQIADNSFYPNVTGWAIAVGPQDDTKDERVRDMLLERNYTTCGSGVGIVYHCNASRSTIRTNVVDLTNASIYPSAIDVSRRGIEPIPDDVCIYNNTIVSNSNGNSATAINITSTSTNAVVKNNLVYFPGTFSFGKVSVADAGTGTIKSNNSTDTQMGSTSPLFSAWPITSIADAKITTGSYGIGSGVPVPVVSDAKWVDLSITTPDCGAVAH